MGYNNDVKEELREERTKNKNGGRHGELDHHQQSDEGQAAIELSLGTELW